jgi:hypothetical protein
MLFPSLGPWFSSGIWMYDRVIHFQGGRLYIQSINGQVL